MTKFAPVPRGIRLPYETASSPSKASNLPFSFTRRIGFRYLERRSPNGERPLLSQGACPRARTPWLQVQKGFYFRIRLVYLKTLQWRKTSTDDKLPHVGIELLAAIFLCSQAYNPLPTKISGLHPPFLKAIPFQFFSWDFWRKRAPESLPRVLLIHPGLLHAAAVVAPPCTTSGAKSFQIVPMRQSGLISEKVQLGNIFFDNFNDLLIYWQPILPPPMRST